MAIDGGINAMRVVASDEECVIVELDENFDPDAVRPFVYRLFNHCVSMVSPRDGHLVVIVPQREMECEDGEDHEPFDIQVSFLFLYLFVCFWH